MIKSKANYFILFLFTLGILGACEPKETIVTETVIEEVIVRDTIYLTKTDTLLIEIVDTIELTDFAAEDLSMIFLSRHADDEGVGSNPILTEAGIERAQELGRLMKNSDLDHVYSSDYNRTKMTASTVADSTGLEVEIYDVFDINSIYETLLAQESGSRSLVIGHSNTTPDLINLLLPGMELTKIDEEVFDNLFLVVLAVPDNGQLIHYKYGDQSP